MSTSDVSTATPSNTDELTVVKHLAAGRSIRFAAAASAVAEVDAQLIAVRHGHPDPTRLAKSIDELHRAHAVQENTHLIPSAETLLTHAGGIVEVSSTVTARLEA